MINDLKDINLDNKATGSNSLDLMAEEGYAPVIDILIKNGEDPRVEDTISKENLPTQPTKATNVSTPSSRMQLWEVKELIENTQLIENLQVFTTSRWMLPREVINLLDNPKATNVFTTSRWMLSREVMNLFENQRHSQNSGHASPVSPSAPHAGRMMASPSEIKATLAGTLSQDFSAPETSKSSHPSSIRLPCRRPIARIP